MAPVACLWVVLGFACIWNETTGSSMTVPAACLRVVFDFACIWNEPYQLKYGLDIIQHY